jgi:hypothetical protein
MMFNGRLNKNEADVWVDLQKETNAYKIKHQSLAKLFLQMPDSISFVSSVDNDIIGSTTIYRDRTRLSMVLVSIAVKDAYQETATYQIVKASLPFFKTVAIRDVDVLVSTDECVDPVGFPLSFEVESWTREVMERVGFEEIAKICQYSFEIREANYHPMKWDSKPNGESAKELIWNMSKPLGLTNSLVWVAHDFALASNNLVTYSINERTSVVAGLWLADESLVVTPFVIDIDRFDWSQLAEAIAAEGIKMGVKRIQFPLIGTGQKGLIEEIEKISSASSMRELSLMRKSL